MLVSYNLNLLLKLLFCPTNNNMSLKICCKKIIYGHNISLRLKYYCNTFKKKKKYYCNTTYGWKKIQSRSTNSIYRSCWIIMKLPSCNFVWFNPTTHKIVLLYFPFKCLPTQPQNCSSKKKKRKKEPNHKILLLESQIIRLREMLYPQYFYNKF